MKTAEVIVLVVLFSPLWYSPLTAQAFPDADTVHALVAARSLKCAFPWYSSVDWADEQPQIKSATQEFSFHIDSINYGRATARLIGNVGAADLTVTKGAYSVSFIERVPAGSFHLTNVYAWRSKTRLFKAYILATQQLAGNRVHPSISGTARSGNAV